jgi:hypothetical protein
VASSLDRLPSSIRRFRPVQVRAWRHNLIDVLPVIYSIERLLLSRPSRDVTDARYQSLRWSRGSVSVVWFDFDPSSSTSFSSDPSSSTYSSNSARGDFMSYCFAGARPRPNIQHIMCQRCNPKNDRPIPRKVDRSDTKAPTRRKHSDPKGSTAFRERHATTVVQRKTHQFTRAHRKKPEFTVYVPVNIRPTTL